MKRRLPWLSLGEVQGWDPRSQHPLVRIYRSIRVTEEAARTTPPAAALVSSRVALASVPGGGVPKSLSLSKAMLPEHLGVKSNPVQSWGIGAWFCGFSH